MAYILQISSEAFANTRLFGRGVDADEDEVGLLDAAVDVGGKEEVLAARLAHDVLEPGLVDRELEVRAVPRVDAGFVEIDDGDGDVRAFECDDSASRSSCKDAFIQSSAFVRECRITNHL